MAISVPPESGVPAPILGGDALGDAELVAAVRSGSDPAFEQLYRRYHRRIAAHVYGMVGDHGRAEDITQEVFMSAVRRMRSTDQPLAFKPWIYQIATNACIDQHRRARKTQEISYDAEEGAGAAARGRLAAAGPSPQAQVDQKAAIENLRGALGGLSPVHHEILVLREFEGLSYREIGARLDMNRASVESTLFRARRRLTEEYAELVSGERCLRVQALIETAELSDPGVRDQRRLRAHLSHCQPCRRHARLAGLDDALFVAPRGLRAKIAAVFPLPAFLQRRWGPDPSAPLLPGARGSRLAQLSAQVGANVDPAVGSSWTKAVAAAAALAAAGAAGGQAVSDPSREYFGGAGPEQAAPPPPRTTGATEPPSASRSAAPVTRRRSAATTSAVGGDSRRKGAATRSPEGRAPQGGARGPSTPAAPAAPALTPDQVIGAAPALPRPALPGLPGITPDPGVAPLGAPRVPAPTVPALIAPSIVAPAPAVPPAPAAAPAAPVEEGRLIDGDATTGALDVPAPGG